VGLFTLYAGLLLPWLGGTLWLVFAESRFEPKGPHNRVRQTGYGFFLGYAVLFMAIIANDMLTGTTSWVGLMLFLGGFAGSGGLAVWLSVSQTGPSLNTIPAPPHGSKSSAVKMLAVLVAVWTAIHLVFITVDIFTQPLYPWDAWLAWVYRAKAWFMAGGMTAVVSPAEWASATATNIYTIDAWTYPLFPSVIPYWAALSLGNWSETLVNLPVLFAGLAIGMALYGQCREYGLGVTGSLVGVYLLYSIPIFATHIALAGYADIWMAGFTGLGFIAVMRAAYVRTANPKGRYGMQMAVGLLMLALAIPVKNEGLVWLLAALGLLLLVTCRARVAVLAAVAIAVLTLFAFTLGITYLDIPLIGTLGIVDGRLVIPFIGNFALELHNVWQVYWDNFFTMGNWNLLWMLVLASLILAIRPPDSMTGSHAQRISLTFISIFLATQLFIFGFTDRGLWADTFTAFNRLPLHFVPALLFAAFMVLNSQLSGPGGLTVGESNSAGRDNRTPKRAREQRSRSVAQFALATVLAAAVVSTGLMVYLARDLPDTNVDALDYPAAGFSFAFGSGHPEQDRMVVDGFANGYTLLSSGPVIIQANIHQVLAYEWVPARYPQEAAFFWRQKGKSDNVIRTEITAPGKRLIDLSTEVGWQGEIVEFGFLLAGGQGDVVEIGQAALKPDSLTIRLQLMWQAWTAFEGRSQQSINFLQGGDYRQVVPLPLLVIVWLLTSLVIISVLPKPGLSTKSLSVAHGSPILVYGSVLFLAGWMLLDIRWTANSFKQARVLLQTQRQAPLSTNLDGEINQYVQRLKADVLGGKAVRILIIGDESAIDYYLLRAKYHLLPNSVDVADRFNQELSPQTLDFVIFFGQPGGIAKVPGWSPSWRRALVEVDRGNWGVVYRLDS